MQPSKGFDFFEYHTQLAQDDVLLSYKGPLTDVLLSEFSQDIRLKLQEEDPKVGKKVFAIFMELAQNVLYYSKEVNTFGNRDRVGTLVIVNTGEYYQLMTGNLVLKKLVPELLEKCDKINAFDRDELREYKRTLRNGPKSEESKGAGIGLVQVALTSGNRVEMKVKEYSNEFAFYVIVVNIKINGQDDEDKPAPAKTETDNGEPITEPAKTETNDKLNQQEDEGETLIANPE